MRPTSVSKLSQVVHREEKRTEKTACRERSAWLLVAES